MFVLCDVTCFVNIHIGLGGWSLTPAATFVYVTSLSRDFVYITVPSGLLTTHPHLAPRLKKEQSYTSTPHLGLRGLL